MSRWPSSPGIAMRPHGTRASRALGDTNNAALGEETESTSNCQASGAIRCVPSVRAIVNSVAGEAKAPLVIARSSASRRVSLSIWIRQCAGQFVLRSAQRRLLDHPRHSLRRLPHHTQADVRGDSDIGESKYQSCCFGSVTAMSPMSRPGGHVAAVPFGGQRAIASQDRTGVRVHLQRRQRAQPRQPRRPTDADSPAATKAYSSIVSSGTAAVAVPVNSTVSESGSALKVPRAL